MSTDTWERSPAGLYKRFEFKDFDEAWAFMTKVAAVANRHNHHPRWENEWNVVYIWLITHESADTITSKDIELANAIDTIDV